MQKNTQYLYTVLRIVPLVVALGGSLLLARVLSPREFGLFAAAQAVTQIINAVQLGGQDQLILQRKLSARTAFTRAFIVVSCSFALSVSIGLLVVRPEAHFAMVLACFGVAASQLSSVWMLLLQSTGRDLQRGALESVQRILQQLGGNIGALGGLAFTAAFGSAVGGLSSFVLNNALARSSKVKSDIRAISTVPAGTWANGLRHGLNGLIFSAVLTVPLLVLTAKLSPEEQAQVRFVTLAYTSVASVASALFGEFYRARLYVAEGRERTHLVRQLWRVLPVGVVLTSVGLILVGLVLPHLIGREYQEAGLAVALLFLDAALTMLSMAIGTLLLTAGNIHVSVIRHMVALLVAVSMILALPPTAITLVVAITTADLAGLVLYFVFRGAWRRPAREGTSRSV